MRIPALKPAACEMGLGGTVSGTTTALRYFKNSCQPGGAMGRQNSARAAIRSALLLGISGVSFAGHALAQNQPTLQAANEQLPEQVLVTGSLIHGTAAVGVPVTTV